MQREDRRRGDGVREVFEELWEFETVAERGNRRDLFAVGEYRRSEIGDFWREFERELQRELEPMGGRGIGEQ